VVLVNVKVPEESGAHDTFAWPGLALTVSSVGLLAIATSNVMA
jgi:hypothetical protein